MRAIGFVLLFGCSAEALPLMDMPASPAAVRVVNLNAGPIAIDVDVDQTIAFEQIGFTQSSDWMSLPSGRHLLSIERRAMPIELVPGLRHTVVVTNWGAFLLEPQDGLRFVHAAPTEGIEAHLVSGDRHVLLGSPNSGQHGPSVRIDPSRPWEIALTTVEGSLVAELPRIDRAELIAAATDEGELFVLVLADDRPIAQLGSIEHRSGLRCTNLSGALEPPIFYVDDEPLVEVPFATGSEHADVAPGTRTIRSGTDQLLFPMRRGANYTALAFGDAGTELMMLEDSLEADLGEETEVLVVNAGAADRIDAWLGDAPIAHDLPRGEATLPVRKPVGSYELAVDVDGDARPDVRFDVSYLPEYRFHLLLGRDREGHLLLAVQSPSGGVWLAPVLRP